MTIPVVVHLEVESNFALALEVANLEDGDDLVLSVNVVSSEVIDTQSHLSQLFLSFTFDVFEDPAEDHVGLLICPEVLDKVVLVKVAPDFARKVDVAIWSQLQKKVCLLFMKE